MVSHIKFAKKLIPINQPELSILENMEANGINMNYQCRDGLCGSCRCQLLMGEVVYQQQALAVLNEEEVLICIARANSSIEIKDVYS